MHHPKMRDFDDRMKKLFDEIDAWLEDKYGSEYPLRPNRMPRNATANPEMDGLFNVGASFTAGYGSKYGRGYAVDISMSTLSHIPEHVRKKIDREVMNLIREKLPEKFPERELVVEKDGNVIKIFGDLSLGTL